MPNPRVGDVMQYRRDPETVAAVKGVSDLGVVMDLDGELYGFGWATFRNLFEASTAP